VFINGAPCFVRGRAVASRGARQSARLPDMRLKMRTMIARTKRMWIHPPIV
jgi:hypothetical protein